MTREEVAKSLYSIPVWALQYHDAERENKEKEEAITNLSKAFQDNIKKIDDGYGYVKKLQKETDLTKIQYTNEYHEATGRIK